MFVVVSYDVADDRRRLRIANTLLDFGARVQFSVFECRLDPPELARLRERLLPLLDPTADRLRIYRLCAACVAVVELHGEGKITDNPDVLIV